MYNLDNKNDFDIYMLKFYTAIYPSGKMTVYNNHPEKQSDGSTVLVANLDKSWTECELPILVALKAMMVSATKTLYENNWELYQHNYSPDNRSLVIPVELTGSISGIEKRVVALEREVAILKS